MSKKNYWNKWRGGKPSGKNLSIAKKALRKVTRLEKKVRPEVKRLDSGILVLTPAIAGLMNHMSAVAQGNTEQSRDGLKIQAIGFTLRFHITTHLTATITAVRIMVIRDNRQEESVIPSVLDVLLSADPFSQNSRVNPKRFSVLYDYTVSLNNLARTGVVKHTFKKFQTPMQFIGAAGSTMTRNGIYILTIGSVGANLPTVRLSFRLFFTDM